MTKKRLLQILETTPDECVIHVEYTDDNGDVNLYDIHSVMTETTNEGDISAVIRL